MANSQPWVWELLPGAVRLHADRNRHLVEADPDGRDLVISCGAALHHAQVAARALEWRPAVERTPARSGGSGALARVALEPGTATGDGEGHGRGHALDDGDERRAVPGAAALLERCTDRRRFTLWPVPDERVVALAAVAAAWGATAVPVVDLLDRVRVQRLVAEAGSQLRGPRVEPGSGVARGDGLLLLTGDADGAATWLVAGEALAAVWLAAGADGLAVLPLRDVVAVPATRRRLRADVLGGLAEPLLLLRLCWQAIGCRDLPRTPRRPVAEVLRRGGP